jgi:hypothetical protein
MFNHLKLKNKDNTREFVFKYFKSDDKYPVFRLNCTNAMVNKKANKFYLDNKEMLDKIDVNSEDSLAEYYIAVLSNIAVADWEGIKDDKGEDVECTPANVKKFFEAVYKLLGISPLDAMVAAAGKAENYINESIEVVYTKAKKLGK